MSCVYLNSEIVKGSLLIMEIYQLLLQIFHLENISTMFKSFNLS